MRGLLLKLNLVKLSSQKINCRKLSWTQFGSSANRENEEGENQLYSERRLLGYSKDQVRLNV